MSTLGEVLLYSSMHQAFDGPVSLLFSCWPVGRKELWWWLHPLCMTQQYPLASMVAWLSSTGISYKSLLPHIPLDLSLCSQQQPSPRDCSTTPKLQLPATAPSRESASLSGLCMAVARTVWFSFHLGCHWSAVSLSALNVSQTTALMWQLNPCFSSLTGWGPVQSYSHSCFPPLSLHPTKFCMILYILFHWSDTPVHSQLVFCMHFCVWRWIPDASMSTYTSTILFSLCS